MRVSDFHFDLPPDLIAQHPPATRGSSRMLVLNRALPPSNPAHLTDEIFANLPNYLQPGDLLVLNDTRVLPARLFATRAGLATQTNSPAPTGQIEVLLTEQIVSPSGENLWRTLVKPARKVHPGETLHFSAQNQPVILSEPHSDGSKDLPYLPPATAGTRHSAPKPASPTNSATNSPTHEFSFRPKCAARSGETRNSPATAPRPTPILTAHVLAAGPFGERTLRFDPTPPGEEDFYARVTRIGQMPLPPYIHRGPAQAQAASSPTANPTAEEDRTRYQTIYAQTEAPPASAAAPTAGLHFTPEVLAALTARGVEIAYLTLHVGLGTFQPVRVSHLADIKLHSERYTLPAATADALNRALRDRRRVIAVGTTTTRTLEHIAAQAHLAPHPGAPSQTVFPSEVGSPPAPALGSPHLDSEMGASTDTYRKPLHLHPHSGETSIFLAPGHHFRIVSGLLTNFHLPESTLLMLAAAFAGDTPRPSATNPGAPRLDLEMWDSSPQIPPNENDPNHGRQTILSAYTHAIHHQYRFYSYGDCMLLL